MEEKRNSCSWTIRCGRHLDDERDRVIVHIIATEEEAKIVGLTVARFERAARNQEVCCVAVRNCDAYEVLICDCM